MTSTIFFFQILKEQPGLIIETLEYWQGQTMIARNLKLSRQSQLLFRQEFCLNSYVVCKIPNEKLAKHQGTSVNDCYTKEKLK